MKLGEEIAQRLAFGQALVELGEEKPNMLVLDADVGPSTQTQLFGHAFPDRFIEVGIAEQNMIGIAAGLSTFGFIPWVSTFAVFMTKRAGDQIRNSVAHTKANVKINGAYGGLPTGRAGATHSAIEDLAVMRSMPNVIVMDPADPQEALVCARLAMEIEGPVYVRTVRCSVPVIFPEDHKIEIGKAVKLHEGKDIAIISCGMMTPRVLKAAEELKKQGISARVLHMATIKPIDVEAICDAAESIGKIITVENHSIIGGLGGAVCEVVSEFAPCRVKRLGFPDIFLESGDDEVFFHRFGLDIDGIASTAKLLAEERGRTKDVH
ncbi:MAG TPA: transketolase C-terminal domain-containing protein [Rectinema sp.]|nr:transketolase C-terminal domain-containing protein [Rectinema sp.]